MNDEPSRRQLLKSAAVGTAAVTGLTGTATAIETDEATNPAQDAPYTVITYNKEPFLPAQLTVPAGATVTFAGSRYPHTITSTESWADVAAGCGDGTEPYDGDAEADSPDGGPDGTKGEDGIIRYTVASPDDSYSVFLESGGTTEITYEAVGRYPYYCIPHCGSFMVGEITVVGVPE